MKRKPLVWLAGQIRTPPFSRDGRIATGVLLCRLQMGEALTMPESRPMPSIGRRCHELRVNDTATSTTWRIIYRVDRDAIVVGEVFAKKTQRTPKGVIDNSKRRFREYDRVCGD